MNKLLLIISGSVAAYKSLELIRRLRERGTRVNVILTRGGAEFITPLSVASLSGTPIYSDLFSLKDETEMGHIRLSREADLVLVAPASADILAKMANGMADDLATATLLATDKKVLVAPAMNVQMWRHPATMRNLAQLQADGVTVIQPQPGSLACGETGDGRMVEVQDILRSLEKAMFRPLPLAGKTALVTSGPTFEPIDPVRFIGNRSSGKQGHAMAIALAKAGCSVTLISGPTALPDPDGIKTVKVNTAEEMLTASLNALPSDIAVCAAAVADWRVVTQAKQKLKKRDNKTPPELALAENPDILHAIARHPNKRPQLVIGFAAETEALQENAARKRILKGCDWIIANDVKEGIFGSDENHVTLCMPEGTRDLPRMGKQEIADAIVEQVVSHFAKPVFSNAGSVNDNVVTL